MTSQYVKIKLRRATSLEWSNQNPVLALGEPGVEIDTKKIKIGDGIKTWNQLDYMVGGNNDPILINPNEVIDDRIANLLVPGANIVMQYDDNANLLLIGTSGLQPAGNYATLVNGLVPSAQLPSYVDDVLEYGSLSGFPTSGDSGKIYVAIDTKKIYRWSGSTYIEISPSPGSTDSVTEGSTNLYFTNARAAAAAPVQSVAGKTGAVSLSKSDIGLGNVDNTGDVNKPISTATQNALDAKANKTEIYNAAVPWTANHTLVDGTRYLAGDLVYDEGKIYRAKFDNESLPTSNTTYWEDLGSGYRLNIDGRDISNIPYPVTSVNGLTGAVTISSVDIGDITFSGVQIIGGGENSGDGNNKGTIELVPDSTLYNNDQYLIVDPTQPNHIHLRAGGAQDNSNAELIVGGELANLKITDYNHQVQITTSDNNDSNYWNFTSQGNLDLPSGKTINWGQNIDTLGPPTAGGATDRIRLWDFYGGGSDYNYAIGAEPNHVWFAMDVNNGTGGFKFYSREDQIFKIRDDGALVFIDGTTQDTAASKSSIGLGNVDNTSDANKPISNATQSALDAKAPIASPTFTSKVAIDNLLLDGNTLSATNTNGNLVIQSNGTGSLQRDSGGNARGQYSVDLQNSRSSNTMVANGNYSVIGGGKNNTASGSYGAVNAGYNNKSSGSNSVVSGGNSNTASATYSTVGGGYNNNILSISNWGVISGGEGNKIYGFHSTIGGGRLNECGNISGNIASINAVIGGGSQNKSTSDNTTVGGGGGNQCSGKNSTIGGGLINATLAENNTIGGGNSNTTAGINSTICGGNTNICGGANSFIGGGQNNLVSGTRSVVNGTANIAAQKVARANDITTATNTITIANATAANFDNTTTNALNIRYALPDGNYYLTQRTVSTATQSGTSVNLVLTSNVGDGGVWSDVTVINTAETDSSIGNTISGGINNIAGDNRSTVGGGGRNSAIGIYATVGGGWTNSAIANNATVAGGRICTASGAYSTVGGGGSNSATGLRSTISGGHTNTASGSYSTIPGGFRAKTTRYGEFSHAAGSFGGITTPGDAQHTVLIARQSTTDATANVVLTLNGSAPGAPNRLTIPAQTCWAFSIKISAYNSTDNQGAWWTIRGGIRRDNSNGTTLIGSIITENGAESSLSTATATVVADDTNEALEIRVTGVAGKDIRWVAVVDLSQVSWGTP